MVAKLQIMTVSVVVAIALIACSSDDGPKTDNSAASSSNDSSSEAAAPLDGTYEITVEQSDTTKEPGASPGTWTLTLTMDPASAHFSGPGGRSVDLNPMELTETRMVVPPDPSCPNNDPGPGEANTRSSSVATRWSSPRWRIPAATGPSP